MKKSIESRVEEFSTVIFPSINIGYDGGYLEAKARDNYIAWITQQLQEVHRQAVEKQNAMFARHIDEIMKITSSPQELVDWLAYYRNTLTNKQNV